MMFPPGLYHRETENIQIGAIIADPFLPDRVLTTPDSVELCELYPPVEVKHENDRLFEWFLDPTAPSFWKRCQEHLFSETSFISVKREGYTQYNLKASMLVTKEFSYSPKQSEIKALLADPAVDQYVKESTPSTLELGSGEKPVYLITGLKFAKGEIAFGNTKTKVTELHIGHNTLDVNKRNQNRSNTSWETEAETLVAYKLLKIEKNHRRRNDSDDEFILSEVTMKGSEGV